MTPNPKRKRYLWGGLLTLAVLIGLAGIILHVKTYQPTSYSNWASQLAQAGYTVKIVHFPLNLAVLAPNQAKKVVGPHEQYVIGGHSLGGAMAARYAATADKKNLKGVFLLAAYADQKGRLDHSKLPVLSVTASRDGVLNWSHYEANKKYLPRDTTFTTISGGNHGGFGSYGHQQGDKAAHISNATQQQQVAHLLIKWLKRIN
ncbi:alpha/beta hydrolase [Ligilactobacillus agilis]|uniref:alpha/beta hydrolase n=1 Tax=Ligilactobacillus agilis TaxID=1601 RepID=UPI00254AD5A4|nr:alpha/beta hydrolase [Ligilactobacillus agilis]MDK6809217.1 alpha/beta hydrolase [Ligilactobacillus agilis]